MYLENALKALSPDQALYDFIFNDKRQKRTILFELGKMKKAENIVPVATSIREVMSEDSNAKSRDAVQWIKYLRKKYSLE
jgi:hypothetical protein